MSDPGPTHPAPVFVDALATLELRSSELSAYDQAIGIRLLHEDPASGAEHYVVRYPSGMHALRHRHTAGHTIVVLDGVLEANGQLLSAGSYAHFPGGVPMHHAPAAGHDCLFVLLFEGPFDVEILPDD